jgi:hypothetical protein
MDMSFKPLHRLLYTLVPACLALAGCGGGGGGGTETPTYTAASSASFSPTTARDKASGTQNVTLHWVYAVNNGQPVRASLNDITMAIAVDAVDVTIDPATLKRQVSLHGPVSGTFQGVAFGGGFSASIGEDLTVSGGKTLFARQTAEIDLQISAEGESATAKLTSSVGAFSPGYEWLLDRDNLDQLAVGTVQTVTSTGSADITVDISGDTPIVRRNVPVAVNDRWTVMEKLPSMAVRGTTYANVVKLARQTQVPDLSGTLRTVTIYYWVAKGVGMIRGQGVFRVLNIDDVIYELTETNVGPA